MHLQENSSEGFRRQRGTSGEAELAFLLISIDLAQVGLDINVVAHSAWQAAPLQFIAGLGLRKAQLLTRTVQREQFLQTRLSLYKNLKVMDKTVFRCAHCPAPCPPLPVH